MAKHVCSNLQRGARVRATDTRSPPEIPDKGGWRRFSGFSYRKPLQTTTSSRRGPNAQPSMVDGLSASLKVAQGCRLEPSCQLPSQRRLPSSWQTTKHNQHRDSSMWPPTRHLRNAQKNVVQTSNSTGNPIPRAKPCRGLPMGGRRPREGDGPPEPPLPAQITTVTAERQIVRSLVPIKAS